MAEVLLTFIGGFVGAGIAIAVIFWRIIRDFNL